MGGKITENLGFEQGGGGGGGKTQSEMSLLQPKSFQGKRYIVDKTK